MKCNLCGRELELYELNYGIHRQMGYGSYYDGDWLAIRFCADCMDSIIDKCNINPVQSSGENNVKQVDTLEKKPKTNVVHLKIIKHS